VFCFTENFHQKEITERQLFFLLPFSPSFFGSRKRGFDSYISKYQNWFKPLYCSLDSLITFFFLSLSHTSFVEFGGREMKHFLQEGKKKRKENKKIIMKTCSAASSSSTKVFLTKPIFWYKDHG